MDITVMENLPTEMLLYIFEMLSYRDLKIAMLVCRRWREIGEIQIHSLIKINVLIIYFHSNNSKRIGFNE